MSESLPVLLDAIKADNADKVGLYPELLVVAAREWPESPLLVAATHGSHRVIKLLLEMQDYCRKFSTLKRAFNLACERGHLPVVLVLLEDNSKLALAKDKLGMIPLQQAVIRGQVDVIKALISAHPESIHKLTPKQETVLHLAVKNSQATVVALLLEEIKKVSDGSSLLHRKDQDGNNVLHIASSKKLVEVVRMLVSCTLVSVNSLNKRKLTPMDLCFDQSPDHPFTLQIGKILYEAGGVRGSSLPLGPNLRWTLETRNVILVVLGIVYGATFNVVTNLPSSFLKSDFPEGVTLYAGDLLSHNDLPPVFYVLTFNTAILMATSGAIIVLLWSLPFRPVVLFVTITVGIVYALLVHNSMPRFFVKVVTCNFPSSVFVGLLALAFICSGALAYFSLSYIALVLKSFLKTKPVHILPYMVSLKLW